MRPLKVTIFDIEENTLYQMARQSSWALNDF